LEDIAIDIFSFLFSLLLFADFHFDVGEKVGKVKAGNTGEFKLP